MSLLSSVSPAPEKMLITRPADPRQSFEAQFNPSEFTHALRVNYNRQQVPGLSHKPLQYVNTDNASFTFTLFFTADTRQQLSRNILALRFLESSCYPRRVVVGGAISSGGPPRLMFLWPSIVALTCVIIDYTTRFTRFSAAGEPLQFQTSVVLEEIRDFRMLSEDVSSFGTIRASDAPRGAAGNVSVSD